MKAGIEDAKKYMFAMRDALQCLHDPGNMYYGRDGHLRLARECGYALDDFTDEAQKVILQGSYSIIYVTRCDLRPILGAAEWLIEVQAGLCQCRQRREELRKTHEKLWGANLQDRNRSEAICEK